MSHFCIVHLSDLHIKAIEDPTYARVREALISDISNLLSNNTLKVDAIVLSGDIVDRGGKAEDYAIAKTFCEKLLSEVGLNHNNLVMIPGNHDIPRHPGVNTLLKNTPPEDYDSHENFDGYWDMFEGRFKNYFEFVNGFSSDENRIIFKYGGAIKDITVDTGKIRFILLNSSWACIGDDDYKNLRVGRWQLEALKEQVENVKDKPDLVLALLHHPIDWLLKQDEELIRHFLLDGELLSADAILHGHIHNGGIDVMHTPDGSIANLVSGIGYPTSNSRAKGMPKMSECRYALYDFNIVTGMVKTWLRITGDNGTFAADTHLYKAGSENGQIQIPFRIMKKDAAYSCDDVCMEVDPVPLISEWVGRKYEFEILHKSQYKAIAITGVGGQGKSALCAEFFRKYARGSKVIYDAGIWVDCRELPDSLHVKIIQVMESISGGKESAKLYQDEKLGDTIKRLLKHLESKRLLIIFDNIDAYVNADTEGAVYEFKPIMDAILDNDHKSLILLTCRPALNDPRASFRHIQLGGLNSEEGVEFFQKRGIDLQGSNDISFCKELVSLSKGHPWWLGLIAGQVRSNRDSLKNCVEKFSMGENAVRSRVKEYLSQLWNNLNKSQQKMLRYLVEASRPLTEAEITSAMDDLGPHKIAKETRRLERLGLLELHIGSSTCTTVYQVHPLIREYVHETYNREAQRQYVYRVVRLFLPNYVVDILFAKSNAVEKLKDAILSPKNLIDSMETCLNSRNPEQALTLAMRFWIVLLDEGYHHQFCFLACRIVDAVNWEKVEIAKIYMGSCLLQRLIESLELIGDTQRSEYYLERFENSVEHNTISYLGYLGCLAYCLWLQRKYPKGLDIVNKYIELEKKLQASNGWGINNIKTTQGLILRDSGYAEKALELFEKNGKEDAASDLGNRARCHHKLKQYPHAEDLLRKSLKILRSKSSYTDFTNLGYAYLWLAEVKVAQGDRRAFFAFLLLAKAIWEEYAPGLLSRINLVEESNEIEIAPKISVEEARKIEEVFLENIS